MTKLLIPAFLVLGACNLTELPQGDCGEGYVQHVSPAGTVRCIKPGMMMLPGAIEGTVLGAAAVAAM